MIPGSRLYLIIFVINIANSTRRFGPAWRYPLASALPDHVESRDRKGIAQIQRVGACPCRKSRATFSGHALAAISARSAPGQARTHCSSGPFLIRGHHTLTQIGTSKCKGGEPLFIASICPILSGPIRARSPFAPPNHGFRERRAVASRRRRGKSTYCRRWSCRSRVATRGRHWRDG
jgi:hypothetical protein